MGCSSWESGVLVESCWFPAVGDVLVCAENVCADDVFAENVCADDVFAENLRRNITPRGNHIIRLGFALTLLSLLFYNKEK